MQKLLMMTLVVAACLLTLAVTASAAPAAATASNDLQGYKITEATVIELDGNVVKLSDLPPYTETVSVNVDQATKTVIRLVLRSLPK